MCCIKSDGITVANIRFLVGFQKVLHDIQLLKLVIYVKKGWTEFVASFPLCSRASSRDWELRQPPETGEEFPSLSRLQRHEDLVSDSGCLSWKMLAENSLQRLPSTLGRLRSLKVLVLDSNQLSILPDEGNYLQKPSPILSLKFLDWK